MNVTLHVWRQTGPADPGGFKRYEASDVSDHASFLEMLDIVNERLIEQNDEPIAFESDCREGICGTCGVVVNGVPHGPHEGITACQLHMRSFNDGDEIWIEPWRAAAFPVIKDLVVDRAPLDRIIEAGGYIAVNTGNAPEANGLPIAKDSAELALDASSCIGCGACVAACPNASAMLFTAAKVGHLAALPQGQPERRRRVRAMVAQMDQEGFGNCTNHGACQIACPKTISVDFIARLNTDLYAALLKPED
jgi:succinate dehydrogenase / fumarate reductase iron-sulfur subunit